MAGSGGSRRALALVIGLVLAGTFLDRGSAGTVPAYATARTMVEFWAGEPIFDVQSSPPPDADYWNQRRDLSVYTPELWSTLADLKVPLGIHLRYQRDFGPVPPSRKRDNDGLRLVRTANRRGVPVLAWLVVPFGDGYWAYEGNAAQTRAAVKAFLDWRDMHGLRFREVTIDSEMSLQTTFEFVSIIAGHPEEFPGFLEERIGPTRQCDAMRAYGDLVSYIHHRGMRVTTAPVPMALDDLLDGNLALQDGLDIAAVPPFGWDELYFQAYRGPVVQAIGIDPGSAWVASYFTDAQNQFGPRGQVTIGIGGQPPYDQLDVLVNDVRMLAGLGATDIPIYSLETTLHLFSVQALRQIVDAASQPLQGADLALATAPTPQALGARKFFSALDLAAAADTPVVTAQSPEGPQLPNAYPEGCGVMQPRPIG